MTFKKSLLTFAVVLASAGILFAQSFNNSDKWSLFNDKADGGSSTIAKESEMVTIEGNEVLAVTLNGKVTTSFQYGYAGAITALKEATGISFYTKGDGKKYRVRVETSDVKDYNYHGYVFTAPKGKMVKVTVPFKKLSQESWGAKKSFKSENASKVSFQTIGQPISSFEFTIADLKPVK